MRCEIRPIKAGSGTTMLQAPPSKSIAHRLLICAALADGVSHISGLELSADIQATIDCLKALGAEIKLDKDENENDSVCELYNASVTGIKGLFSGEEKLMIKKSEDINGESSQQNGLILNCNESGSTLRFLIPVCTLLFTEGLLPVNEPVTFKGAGRLLARPLDVYDRLFKYTYVNFTHNPDSVEVSGSLMAGDYCIDGNVSSQFITGLMLTLPMLGGNSRIRINPPVESRPYIDITISVLKEFGVDVNWEDENTIYIPGSMRPKPVDKTVEGDWSNGAILYALAVIQRQMGRNIVLTGLREESVQGDKAFLAMLEAIDRGDTSVDISDCPDLGPILMAYMAIKGGGRLTGTSRLSIKESDRGLAMKAELEKMGATVVVEGNDIRVISDNGLSAPTDIIDGHNDHRIVMSMAVLCTIYGGIIEGAEAVNKSFPSFFEVLRKVGMDINVG